jgi:uncharacterized membrane protein YeaQ/YmgE (transglycosylase-associated protein family)
LRTRGPAGQSWRTGSSCSSLRTRDVSLGIGGAIIGGWIFAALSTSEATGTDVFGLVVTIASAAAALVVSHTLFPHVRS